MIKVGITERGDAGLDFSWVKKLLDANIIITKNLNDTIIQHLIDNKEKIILHITCTGYGGTVIEPNVPTISYTYNQFYKLIDKGFPSKQIVLRVDPIVPTTKGISLANQVMGIFADRIQRVRFSFLDQYPHVKNRFEIADIKQPFFGFTAPHEMMKEALNMLELWEPYYQIESCAEINKYQLGCISQKDFDILGIKEEVIPVGFQRKGCMCIAGKTELLTNKKKCPHGCLYCYWKG